MIHRELKRKYTVQQVADILGVYRGTVINYEKRSIFPTPRRNPINGYRVYAEEDVAVLKKILSGGVGARVSTPE
ncbi:MAG: MerR family transcriptional regulator [Candidatus Omnitrophica bacterium]|nr:MerR family transcriptional regulator [Candidatus Omnitrophota bacterium]